MNFKNDDGEYISIKLTRLVCAIPATHPAVVAGE